MPRTQEDSELKYALTVEEATLKTRLNEIREERNSKSEKKVGLFFNWLALLIVFVFMWVGSVILIVGSVLGMLFMPQWFYPLGSSAGLGIVMFVCGMFVNLISCMIYFTGIHNYDEQLKKLRK